MYGGVFAESSHSTNSDLSEFEDREDQQETQPFDVKIIITENIVLSGYLLKQSALLELLVNIIRHRELTHGYFLPNIGYEYYKFIRFV
ncbi:hypothetical protein AVEN_104670-1 [Araneus ventricosus]|uniref:Uncharacterized protein n=1 Tax=Araneus ventricosus TaxID=182803 RepID=A0A4Y2BD91_ARAVE|nr:hypothetical protein AVEN_104670-1 [Araneus ventricosus]